MEFKDVIDKTGYPLQIKLKYLVAESWYKQQQTRWHILFDEHHWINGSYEGFIDLVLRSSTTGGFPLEVRVVIECKRISGNWTFLVTTDADRTWKTSTLVAENESLS